MNLVLLSQDLMIGARLEGAARKAGLAIKTVRDQASLAEQLQQENARVLVVDLQTPGLEIGAIVETARASRDGHLPIVASGPHVHAAKLSAASAAGCDTVVSRGQLDREAESILQSLIK